MPRARPAVTAVKPRTAQVPSRFGLAASAAPPGASGDFRSRQWTALADPAIAQREPWTLATGPHRYSEQTGSVPRIAHSNPETFAILRCRLRRSRSRVSHIRAWFAGRDAPRAQPPTDPN